MVYYTPGNTQGSHQKPEGTRKDSSPERIEGAWPCCHLEVPYPSYLSDPVPQPQFHILCCSCRPRGKEYPETAAQHQPRAPAEGVPPPGSAALSVWLPHFSKGLHQKSLSFRLHPTAFLQIVLTISSSLSGFPFLFFRCCCDFFLC